jgi:hypothetical protein
VLLPVTSQPKTEAQQNSDDRPTQQYKLHVNNTTYSRTNVTKEILYSKILENAGSKFLEQNRMAGLLGNNDLEWLWVEGVVARFEIPT